MNYLKLAIYASSAIIVGVLFWRVCAWHSGYKQFKSAQAALQAEIDCNEGSHCASRLLEEAQNAAKAVKSAQEAAQAQNEKDKAERDKAAQEAAQGDARKIEKYKSKLAEILAKPHTLTCDEWLKQVNPCPMEE